MRLIDASIRLLRCESENKSMRSVISTSFWPKKMLSKQQQKKREKKKWFFSFFSEKMSEGIMRFCDHHFNAVQLRWSIKFQLYTPLTSSDFDLTDIIPNESSECTVYRYLQLRATASCYFYSSRWLPFTFGRIIRFDCIPPNKQALRGLTQHRENAIQFSLRPPPVSCGSFSGKSTVYHFL